jgi:septum formation protein
MLVLASNSPRRRELLSFIGLQFTVMTAKINESVLFGESPSSYVSRLSKEKAEAVSKHIQDDDNDLLVIAADTAVVDTANQNDPSNQNGDEILGKPTDFKDAERILRRLRNRSHQVFTALTVQSPNTGKTHTEVIKSEVMMRNYSDEEMHSYINSGDPLDKAGAYAIQHPTFNPVTNFHDCFANVMGLPICHLARILMQFDIYPKVAIHQVCQRTLHYNCQIYQNIFSPKSEKWDE